VPSLGKGILAAYWAALVKSKAPQKWLSLLSTWEEVCWSTVNRLGLTAQGRYRQTRESSMEGC